MVEVFIVSHGDFAKAMLGSCEMIMGTQEYVHTFGFYPGESADELREKLSFSIEDSLNRQNEVLVLTDFMSGSPFNVTASLMQQYSFQHLSGINLPLLLEIMGTREFSDAKELCNTSMSQWENTLVYVNRITEGEG